MAIKTINGILKADSNKTVESFNTQIKSACDNAEVFDDANDYVGVVFNLKDNKIDLVPSTSVENAYGIADGTVVGGVTEGGSGGDDEYIRESGIPSKVGGASAGTTFDGTVAEALDKILYPFVKPTFSTFTLSGQLTSLEVGESIQGGDRTFNWGTNKSENVEPNTIRITSGGATILDGAANDGFETFDIGSNITKTSNSTHFFYIYGTDTQGDSFNRIYAVYWKWRFYYGSSPLETIDGSEVKSLGNDFLYTTRSFTYNTPANNYKWICYPAVFGTATKFEDTATGFGVVMEAPQTISITNEHGATTDYLCYRSTNSMAGSVSIKVS